MDTSDPEISFDRNGKCDHCQNFYKNIEKELNNQKKNKFKKLQALTTQILKSKNNEGYECLIGLSGGVDSSYLLHFVVN
jgi:tRNA(Ile)-lysidine synthase TilS/MesJ